MNQILKNKFVPHLFTGSYHPDDCQFLLTPLQIEALSILEKEKLIQSGKKHYSEMISAESLPSPLYFKLFKKLTLQYKKRLAREVISLAYHIAQTYPTPITLVSLARAGTPIGILLQRALSRHLHMDSQHYSISIIRDRGIDQQALNFLLNTRRRPAEGVVFIDAWTAKGIITQEFKQAIADWNQHHSNDQLNNNLYVISDIAGVANGAATYEDYPIPSGVLNALVSGLISRTILNDHIQTGQFHGCIYYDHLQPYDLSNWFINEIESEIDPRQIKSLSFKSRIDRFYQTKLYLEKCTKEYGIENINYIKPGIAEATRVILRRIPERILLKNPDSNQVAHLVFLAKEKQIVIDHKPEMPFAAMAFIKTIN
ncbi:cysteine protease StiP family protein [Candidatus Nitrosacidococcus sp. I8]|uniref:cysteine protease StiP family protein n=1 Tax=Candidatus Nitrosacidococcus sp. I8 TaxID=2942908 RepID=UPI002225D331|nr:cysteine protease StiP family protein [Candidatus Nitrosacidococcus sp. I8]CAH9018094.1 Cysteine protease StiP [Candidatus Nitrosacidococcus sp. I8]